MLGAGIEEDARLAHIRARQTAIIQASRVMLGQQAQKQNTGLVLGLAVGGLVAVAGAAYAIASWSSRRGFADARPGDPRKPRVSIRPHTYRDRVGFLVIDSTYRGVGARIFVRGRAAAEKIRDLLKTASTMSWEDRSSRIDEAIRVDAEEARAKGIDGAGLFGDPYTIKRFGPDGKLVGQESVSLSKRDVVDVAKIKLHPSSPRVEIWKGHLSFSTNPTRWRTFKLSGGQGQLGAVDWLATSQSRWRATASERRLYGGRAVTEFFVYRREDRDDPKKWYKVRGYGPTPGERKTFAIRRAQEMAAQGVPPPPL